MSRDAFAGVSLGEMIVLVIVLALFLLIVAGQLRSIAKTLQEVTWGARAVERQLREMRLNASNTNRALEEIARTLPGTIEKAERLGGGSRLEGLR